MYDATSLRNSLDLHAFHMHAQAHLPTLTHTHTHGLFPCSSCSGSWVLGEIMPHHSNGLCSVKERYQLEDHTNA